MDFFFSYRLMFHTVRNYRKLTFPDMHITIPQFNGEIPFDHQKEFGILGSVRKLEGGVKNIAKRLSDCKKTDSTFRFMSCDLAL